MRQRVVGVVVALGSAAIAAPPALAERTPPLPIPASEVTHPFPFTVLDSAATPSPGPVGPPRGVPLPPGFSFDQPGALPSTELEPAPAAAEAVVVVRPTGIDWANVGMGSGLGIVASLFAAGALVISRRHRRPGPA